jgi:transposase
MKIIRTSKHTIKYSNTNKLNKLSDFISEYANAVKLYVDYFWNNDIHWFSIHKSDNEEIKIHHIFSINKELYDCPSMFDYNCITFQTKLSARALSSAITQACGIVKSHSSKLQKMSDKLDWMIKTNKSDYSINKYKERINNIKKIDSISLNNIYPELSSKCCSFISDNRYFNGWIKLSSIGDSFGHIYIPIKFHQHSIKLSQSFGMMSSFLICSDHIDIRWNKSVNKKTDGIIIGADPGVNRICSFSHINNFDSDEYKQSLKKIARKRKNSISYKKAIKHRKIIVNHFINNINLSNVKQINLENNSDIHYKNYKGRFLSHYSYSEIKNKIETIAIEQGVLVQLQGSCYKSQRCSNCGWTQKSNRIGKLFKCKHCNFSIDADFNSSINQTHKLVIIPLELLNAKLNRSGFFWNSSGLFSLDGQELRIPDSSLCD